MTPEELKSLRATLGLTQPQLAERLGVQPNTVYRWEAGIHPISPMVARLMATLAPQGRRATRPR